MPLETVRPNSTKLLAALGVALLPLVAFYSVLWHEMRNLPIIDDYHTIIEFDLVLRKLPSLGSKLLWIVIAQHNDYKLVLLHLLVAIQYALTGHVEFTVYMVTGNLMVLGILWLYWRHSFPEEASFLRRIVLFLPICYVLFQLNWVENLDWAITDLQTVPVLLFAMATVHFLIKPGQRSFVVACLCAVAGCGSSINGFLMAPVGLLILVPRRSWGRATVWTVTFAVCLAVYLYHYVPYAATVEGKGGKLATKALFFVSLSGGSLENMSRLPVKGAAIVLGAVLLGVFAHACWRRYDLQNPFAFYTVVWVLLTGLLITEGRTIGGITLSLTGRYKIYCNLLLIFAYVYTVSNLQKSSVTARQKQWLYGLALSASALLCAGSDYFGYKFLVHRRLKVAEGLREFEADPAHNPPVISFTDQPIPQIEPQHDRVLLIEAAQTGVYRLPPPEKR